MEPVWRIALFGELRAERGDRVVTRFRTRKTAALLAHLAFHVERGHPRELLVELLWPGAPPEAGRNGLSRELSSLRSQLEPPGVEPGSIIRADRASVGLDPSRVTTDVRRFEQAVKAATRGGPEGVALLEEAVSLYAGDLLPGAGEEWVRHERERLRGAFLAAARELASRLERAGERARARDALRRALAVDPLSEETGRELMKALARAGDPHAALRVGEELEQSVARELDAPPSLETRELVREIRASVREVPRSAASPALPAKARPREAALEGGTLTFLATLASEGAGLPGEERIAEHSGRLAHTGPELQVAGFARASDALACALSMLGEGVSLALETGDVEPGSGPSRDALVGRARGLGRAAAPGQLLLAETTAALVRGDLDAGVRLADLGVFRLDGAEAPERIFQLLREGGAGPASPRGARRIFDRPLPLELSRFFGREREAALLRELLAPGKTRLVTITGTGGIGKTRLALHVVPGLVEPFLGAVAFVPLADLSEPAQIQGAIAAALRVDTKATGDPLDAIAAALPDPSLLVLDNFEHLVAGGAATVKALLERRSGLACLVTSRQRLGLAGERELPLAPLPVPAAGAPAGELEALASVRIFLDRARAVRPEASLESLDARAVADLVRHLEGIPLALALAAGRTQVLSPAEILARLGERRDSRVAADLLASREKDVPERHRTLRAAIDASHDLLPERLRRVFARLHVFRGGFTLEAAAVVGEDVGLDDLAELCECSLLGRDLEASRFKLLEAIRELAAEKLEEGERELVERRHAEHFLAFAERAASELAGPGGGPWLERLARDQENLRAGIAWSLAKGEDLVAVRFVLALAPLWLMKGPVGEARELVGRVLARPGVPPPLRAKALLQLAGFANSQADFVGAQRHVNEALEIFRSIGDRQGVATALGNLGITASNLGDLALARSVTEEAYATLSELGNKPLAAMALGNLAALARRSGETQLALARLEESLALGRAIGNRRIESLALFEIAIVSLSRGAADRARSAAEEALSVARAIDATRMVGLALGALALASAREGDLERARSLREESRGIFERMNDGLNLIDSHLAGVRLSMLSKDGKGARSELEAVLRLAPQAGTSPLLARLEGDVARLEGDGARARERYRTSIALQRTQPDALELAPALEGLAFVDRSRGEPRDAARFLAAAAALRERMETEPWPTERAALDEERRALEDALGQEAFARLWESGRTLAPERLLEA